MRKKIFVTLGVLALISVGVIAGYQDKQVFVINDSSLANNDTISTYVDIGSAPNVAIMIHASDTVDATVRASYGFGATQKVAVAAADSLNAIGTTVPVSAGKVLRGYGLATDKIPGANRLYLKVTVNQAASAVGENVKVSVITAD